MVRRGVEKDHHASRRRSGETLLRDMICQLQRAYSLEDVRDQYADSRADHYPTEGLDNRGNHDRRRRDGELMVVGADAQTKAAEVGNGDHSYQYNWL